MVPEPETESKSRLTTPRTSMETLERDVSCWCQSLESNSLRCAGDTEKFRHRTVHRVSRRRGILSVLPLGGAVRANINDANRDDAMMGRTRT